MGIGERLKRSEGEEGDGKGKGEGVGKKNDVKREVSFSSTSSLGKDHGRETHGRDGRKGGGKAPKAAHRGGGPNGA